MRKIFKNWILTGVVFLMSTFGSVAFAASPSPLTFSPLPSNPTTISASNPKLVYTLSNALTTPLYITNYEFTSSQYFAVNAGAITDNCNHYVPPGKNTCNITVNFTSLQTGITDNNQFLSLQFGSGALLSSTPVTLTIEGTTSPPAWNISPGVVAQSSVTVGSPDTVSFSVNNTGTTAVNLTGATPSASPDGILTVSPTAAAGTTCTATLAANSTCTYVVGVTGAAAGSATVGLAMTSSNGGNQSATATGPITVSAAFQDLTYSSIPASPQNITIGSPATNLIYTVSNPNTTAVPITGTSFTTSPDFTVGAISNTCSNSVPASGTCTITVPVTGTTAGTAAGQSLTVSYTGGGPLVSTPISIIVANSVPVWNISPGVVAQSSVTVGSLDTVSFSVNNTGTSAVSLTGATPSASPDGILTVSPTAAAGTTCTATLAANSTCTYVVGVTGATAGSATVGLAMASSNGGSQSATAVGPITVSAAFQDLTYSSIPASPQNITIGSPATNLIYTVSNPNTTAVPITGTSFTTSPDFTTGAITNSCASSIPASGTCTITVPVTGTTAGTVAGQSLTVSYTGGVGSIVSTPITIAVANAASASWTVTAAVPDPANILPGQSFNVTYTVNNTSTNGASLTLQSATPAVVGGSTALANVALVTGSGAGTCVAGTPITPGNSCTYVASAVGAFVSATPPGSNATAQLSLAVTATDNTTQTANSSNITVIPLRLTATAGAPTLTTLTAGQQTQVTFTITNNNYENITLSNPIATASDPAALTAVTIDPSSTCSGSLSANSSCAYIVTAQGGTVTASATSTLNLSVQAGDTYGNAQQASAVSSAITVSAAAGSWSLSVSKPSPAGPLFKGGTSSVVLSITNNSTSSLDFSAPVVSLDVTDAVTISSPSGSCATVAAGATCDLTYTATANSPAYPGVSLNFQVDSTQGTPSSQSISSAPIEIIPEPLTLTVSQQPPTPIVGISKTAEAIFTLSNVSDNAIVIKSYTLAPATDGAILNAPVMTSTTCPAVSATLGANSSCTYTVSVTAAGIGSGPAISLTVQGEPQIAGQPAPNSSIQTNSIDVVGSDIQALTYSAVSLPAAPVYTNLQKTIIFTISNPNAEDVSLNSINLTNSTTDTAYTPVYLSACKGTKNDSINVVPAKGLCFIHVIESHTSTAGKVNQTLAITYGPNDEAVQAGSDNQGGDINYSTEAAPFQRTVTFINQCKAPVWLGNNPGSPNTVKNQAHCTSNADCPTNASCVENNPIAGTAQCFWDNPVPPNNDYQIAAGDQMKIFIPYDTNTNETFSQDPGEIWNGAFIPRTGCDNKEGLCATADCSQGPLGAALPKEGACMPGAGPEVPFTKIEPNFQTGVAGVSTDYYDISMVDGMNVPASITPTGSVATDPSNPYTCTEAGGAEVDNSAGNIGACKWNFDWQNVVNTDTLPNNQWSKVTNIESYVTNVYIPNGVAAKSCQTSSDCESSQVCGLSSAQTKSPTGPGFTLQPQCGAFLGYWTPAHVCGNSNGLANGAPYYCSSKVTDGPTTTLLTHWYACDGASGEGIKNGQNTAVSCYAASNPGSLKDGECCGCQNWDQAPTNLTEPASERFSAGSIVQECSGATTSWMGYALPLYSVLKSACPSAYTYQFDDKTSTFQCSNGTPGKTANNIDYTVTLCPNGASGAPSA